MTLAHIAGIPFEEWVGPLATTGAGIAIALRASLRRVRRGVSAIDEDGRPPVAPPGHGPREAWRSRDANRR